MADKKKKGPSKHSAGMQFEIEKRLQDNDMPTPHEFLADIMSGTDPRKDQGQLFELVEDIIGREDLEGLPSLDDWATLKNLVFECYQKERIILKDSMDAAKELMNYMYPKKKAIEVTGELGHMVKVVPLTKEEVDTFEQRFLDDFE